MPGCILLIQGLVLKRQGKEVIGNGNIFLALDLSKDKDK